MIAPNGAPLCWVPPGNFIMGADDEYPEEAPAHPLHRDGFWMERTPVTNEDFRRFAHSTGASKERRGKL
jgi:sulfatase modifying factor 1